MPRIKKPTTSGVVPSRADQIKEIVKCGSDASYFISKYVKISHPTKGQLPFKTFPYQDRCLKAFQSHRFVITNKSRQLGLSTLSAAYSLWMALFQKEKNVLVIATRLEVAKNFIKKVNGMYDSLPNWLVMPQIKARSVRYLEFSNGSKVQAVPTGTDAGRSEALSLLIIDEAAHVEGIDDLWLGLWPTLSTGGSAILISSPSGVGTLFHKIWVGAKEGEDGAGNIYAGQGNNNFYRIELPWTVHPERNEEWFESQKAEILPAKGERGVAQELLCVGDNTNILTIDGCKKASEIAVGDYVLTHKGRYKKVNNVAKRNLKTDENLFEVSQPGNRKNLIYITGNHPIYNYHFHLPKNHNQFTYLKNQLIEQKIDAEFNSIDELNIFSSKTNKRIVSVLHPKLNIENNNPINWDLSALCQSSSIENNKISYKHQKYKNKRHVIADYNLGYFIGLVAAEGCVFKNSSKKGTITETMQIALKLSEERNTIGKWIEEYLSSLDVKYTVRERDYSDCFTILTCNKYIIALYKQYVIDGNARNKHLNMTKILESGEKFIRGYISGHFAGDGDHEYSVLKNNFGNKLKVVCKSQKMLYQIRTLLTAFGHYGRIGHFNNEPSYLEIDGLKYKKLKNITEIISQPRTKNIEQKTSRIKLLEQTGEIVGIPIWSKVEHDKVNFVVDIEVEEDHSFIADSLVVHNCSFNSSGDAFLKSEILDLLEANTKTPVSSYGPSGNVLIWKYAEPEHKYIITADIARGDAGDFSTIQVIDTNADEQVAEFQGKIPPDDLAELMIDLGFKYNQALLCPELNSFGLMTATHLKKSNYKNLFFEKFSKNIFMTPTSDEVRDEMPGITTNVKSREEMLAKLEGVLRNRKIRINSMRFVNELKTFIWKNNKAQAMKGYNDDLVIAMAIACTLYEASGVTAYDSLEVAKSMLFGMSKKTGFMEQNGKWGQKNDHMPPIIPGNSSILQNNEQIRTKSNSTTQNMNTPFWRQFDWVNR